MNFSAELTLKINVFENYSNLENQKSLFDFFSYLGYTVQPIIDFQFHKNCIKLVALVEFKVHFFCS